MSASNGGADEQQVGDLGEFGLIDLVTAGFEASGAVLLGPGDDAAHVAARHGSIVVSTDLLVEGRHFRRDWSGPVEVGRKAAAANLSDVNAMGGVGTALTVGLGVPADLPVHWVRDLARGFAQECALVGAAVVGGDLSDAGQVVVSVTAIGDAVRPVTRSGAMPGDVVAVAGTLGLSAAGLAALSRGFRSPRAAVEAHRVPTPPYPAGPQAALAGATAMIDVSDGLVADLGHVARASGVVVEVDTHRLEVPAAVATVAEAFGGDPLDYVLTGGEDFALAATFSAQTDLPTGWRRIGVVRDPRAGEPVGVLVDGAPREGSPGHRHWR
ncbi:MAG: thiamine-phosphate kinase [Aeromicrobium erythreum]